MSNNKISHPSHYNLPGKKECIEQMREDYGNHITAIFCLTNAYKYLYRAGNKENEDRIDDISKAIWYYDYVNDYLFSAVSGNKTIKLYKSVESMLCIKRREVCNE